MRNFIILIGGPGRFVSCDRAHDQTWNNYLVPPQLACMRNSFKRAEDERIHWVVYAPPYEGRWSDDSTITEYEKKKEDDGAWLHSLRKNAAMKVQRSGAKNYLHRIELTAGRLGLAYKAIRSPQEFWDHIATFPVASPKSSISRVWYFGHAGEKGLMLALTHNAACQPYAEEWDMIWTDKLSKHASLADRFDPKTQQASRFYGCSTSAFAKKWKEVFKVPAEGADLKIDFGVVNRASTIPDVLERLQKTPTSFGDPGWTRH